MAEMTPEMAFLQSMQSNTNNYNPITYQNNDAQQDEEEEEEYDPSHIVPDQADDSNRSTPMVQSASEDEAATPSRPVSQASDTKVVETTAATPTRQPPKTLGGFIVDDDDDDEDETPVTRPKLAGSNGLLNVAQSSTNTPKRSLTQTPNAFLTPDVSIQKTTQEQGVSDVPSNGPPDSTFNHTAVLPNPSAELDSTSTNASQTLPVVDTPTATSGLSASLPKSRLPHDRVGILEDRIADDPRGDLDAWLSLINEHRKRNKLDEARGVYDRFFKVFPTAAEQIIAYVNMELQNDDFFRVEQIFTRFLMNVHNVHLWSTYLDYVRRRNNLTTDTTGAARQIVSQTYEFVLQTIGHDKDAGPIWSDYIQFVKSGPGVLGGNGWQDQQKMDTLRKAYQRAICVPTQAVTGLWKEYDNFEMGLNKMTGRKFLQEKSPAYMTARSANMALQNLTKDLDRTTLPRLPPALGFDGDVEYMNQVEIWKRWINWEKEDNLVLKDEDLQAYKSRIVYVYKQALMALRFWPEMWYDAAEFCFQNDMESAGNDFLTQGIAANPESCLLAFRRADRVELTTADITDVKERGDLVKEPYNTLFDALYELINITTKRETQAIARVKESFAQQALASPTRSADGDEAGAEEEARNAREATQKAQIEAIRNGNAVQIKLLSKTVSYAWIAYMRAIRRIQGKGKPGDAAEGGMRQAFVDARRRGRITSDVYIANALMEHHCYQDASATRIFERGMKLFPEDENFALEYLKHLITLHDIINVRMVFESVVNKITQKPENTHKAKVLYLYFHEYESRYGELGQLIKLEKRMHELFPDDPQLSRFAHRYASPGFDPTAIRPIISPTTQAKPRSLPTIGIPPPVKMQDSPRPSVAQVANSPKRPLEESDNEAFQPRKMIRAESPLKGAAGRRLDAKRNQQRAAENHAIGKTPNIGQPLPPPPLPREISYLLSIIPRAETYKASTFAPHKMVELLRNLELPQGQQLRPPIPGPPPSSYGQLNGPYQFHR
ncbi:Suf-domain-containing protein [Patellaria atrata CBS 101060]|uniref:mRNA 3'-end-processing protein RNA14 n=1 Tax=Patellaria atrata CBS 101060 TaxID=1346257 RepID=A0A9P4S9R4_9PEZI|nr:Suf-domain-containing protein [Patellaria atrata CBS 101060]